MFGFLRKKQIISHEAIARSYATIAAQARHPTLYTSYGVPDTMDARFELLLLHLFVVLERFKDDEDERVRRAVQELCDLFFTEMDRAMRETGVGDLTVPKRIKKMAQIYAARMATYYSAAQNDDKTAFPRALALHIYGDEAHIERGAALADYVETLRIALSTHEALHLWQKSLWLPPPDQAAQSVQEKSV